MKQKWTQGLWGLAVFAMAIGALIYNIMPNARIVDIPIQPMGYDFEYSLDGENWQELTASEALPGKAEEVFLRGHFSEGIEKDRWLVFWLNHMFFTMAINGEVICDIVPDTLSERWEQCGLYWYDLKCRQEIGPEALVELKLQSQHPSPESDAYNSFLDNIYYGDREIIHDVIAGDEDAEWGIGLMLVIIAIVVMIIGIPIKLMRMMVTDVLFMTALTILSTGLYVIVESENVFLWKTSVVFHRNGSFLMMMLMNFCLLLCMSSLYRSRTYNIVRGLTVISAACNVLAMRYCFKGDTTICDRLPYWISIQLLILVSTVGAGIMGLRRREFDLGRKIACSMMLPMLTLCTDYVLMLTGHSNSCNLTQWIICLMLAVWMIWILKKVPEYFGAHRRVQALEHELEEHRITIMLSQIRPHFLYNSLNAIRYLCKDSPLARDAIKNFADYLRGNLESLDRRTPVFFELELEHIKTYMSLEKLRFGDELMIEYDIETTAFKIPALTVQPILENAVKHGVGKAENGGTVRLSTREYSDHYEVIVTDDGVGYEPLNRPRDGRRQIGIENVRQRLNRMIGATLEIESAPGRGTKATIRIQKENGDGHHNSGR